jgi:hypothetical protein
VDSFGLCCEAEKDAVIGAEAVWELAVQRADLAVKQGSTLISKLSDDFTMMAVTASVGGTGATITIAGIVSENPVAVAWGGGSSVGSLLTLIGLSVKTWIDEGPANRAMDNILSARNEMKTAKDQYDLARLKLANCLPPK